ncbi:hypothetical protein [Mycolicibacterium fortuitum]|nr:hypothetical protein [Mycolicibacterium fortuitum]
MTFRNPDADRVVLIGHVEHRAHLYRPDGLILGAPKFARTVAATQ